MKELDYEHTEVSSGSDVHKLAVAHWDYVKGVLINAESNINHKLLDVIGFHYVTAFKHGFKHGKDDKMSKELTEEQKEFLRHCRKVLDNAKKIECPYCHYDGSDSKIGFSMPYVETGCVVPRVRCKKCKCVFDVIWESKTGKKII